MDKPQNQQKTKKKIAPVKGAKIANTERGKAELKNAVPKKATRTAGEKPKKVDRTKQAAATKKVVQLEVAKRKSNFLEVYKNNMCIVATSCLKAGISRQTFYEWRREDSDFASKCEEIEELQKDMAEASILKQIKEGNTTMTIFYAKTKMRDRGYGEKVELDHHTEVELDFSKLSDEELLQYNELLNKMHKTESKE